MQETTPLFPSVRGREDESDKKLRRTEKSRRSNRPAPSTESSRSRAAQERPDRLKSDDQARGHSARYRHAEPDGNNFRSGEHRQERPAAHADESEPAHSVVVPRVKLPEEVFHGREIKSALVARPEDFTRRKGLAAYFYETTADPNNIAFGSLYKKDVPLYRRVRATHRSARASAGDVHATGAVVTRYYKRRRPGRRARRARRAAVAAPPSGEGGAASDGYISVHSSEDSNDDDAELGERRLRSRVAELNARVREDERDADRWIALYDLQDEMVAAGMIGAPVANEKKISILAKGLASNAEHAVSFNKLLLRYLNLIPTIWSAVDVDSAFVKAAAAAPALASVWLLRLSHALRSLSLFSVQLARHICRAGLAELAEQPPSADVADARRTLALCAVRLECATGYQEYATAILQAILEFSLFAPLQADGKDLDVSAKAALFRAFWNSGAARIGEPHALGWTKWVKETRSRLSGTDSILSAPRSTDTAVGIAAPPSPPPSPPPPPPDAHLQSAAPPPPPPPPPPTERSAPDGQPRERIERPPSLAADEESSQSRSEDGSSSDSEWSSSSGEERQEAHDVGDDAAAAYRTQEADAGAVLEKWLSHEDECDAKNWLPLRSPLDAGLRPGLNIPLQAALRLAECVVDAGDVLPLVQFPQLEPRAVEQWSTAVVAELVGMLIDWWPWQWREDSFRASDVAGRAVLAELSSWRECPAVTLCNRLLRQSDGDRRMGAAAAETGLSFLLDGGDLAALGQAPADRVAFATSALEAVAWKLPQTFGTVWVTLLGTFSGAAVAKSAAKRLLKASPDNISTYAALASVFLRSGQVGNALQIFTQLLRMDPKNPSPEALCGVIRVHLRRHGALDGVGTAMLSAVHGTEDSAVRRMDLLRFRRLLQAALDGALSAFRADAHPPAPLFAAAVALLVFEASTMGVEAAEKLGGEQLQAVHSEELARTHIHRALCFAILSAALRSPRDARTSSVPLRHALQAALRDNPSDLWCLGVYGALACGEAEGDARRFFFRLSATSADTVACSSVANFVWTRLGQSNRAESFLDRCVAHGAGAHHAGLWRALVAARQGVERRRREFLRSVGACGWCRVLWTDALRLMRQQMSRAEALDLAAIIDEKGIRSRESLVDKINSAA